MIVDHERFIAAERPGWERLDALVRDRARDPWGPLTLETARELDALYQRATADLVRLEGYAAHPEVRAYLEGLVARAFAQIHGTGARRSRWKLGSWFWRTLPGVFRRRIHAFLTALALCLAGVVFGAGALQWDPPAKAVLLPFSHLQGDPAQRVAREERERGSRLENRKAEFSGTLMTHNTRVALTCAAGGATLGTLTAVLTFYNGVILGAVVLDYLRAGQAKFLCGWLLPHGSVEIPAFLVAAQAGFVLAGAFLGRGTGLRLGARLRAVLPDFATLCGGAALMLVWAGLVEAFLSQYHEPVIPYSAKIVLGLAELLALLSFFALAGRGPRSVGK